MALAVASDCADAGARGPGSVRSSQSDLLDCLFLSPCDGAEHSQHLGCAVRGDDCGRDAHGGAQERCLDTGGVARARGSGGLYGARAAGSRLASGAGALGFRICRLLDGILDGLFAAAGVEQISPLVSIGSASGHVALPDLSPRRFPDTFEGGAGERESFAKCRRALHRRHARAGISWSLVCALSMAVTLAAYATACEQRGSVRAGASAFGDTLRDGAGRMERQSLRADPLAHRLYAYPVSLGQAVVASNRLARWGQIWGVEDRDTRWVVQGHAEAEDPRIGNRHLATLYHTTHDAEARRHHFYRRAQ